MAETIVVSCGAGGTGAAALVRPSTTKTTTRMQAGKSHGYSIPNGEHLLVERLGHAPVAIRNNSTRPASITEDKPAHSKHKLVGGKAYQLPEHCRLTISI